MSRYRLIHAETKEELDREYESLKTALEAAARFSEADEEPYVVQQAKPDPLIGLHWETI